MIPSIINYLKSTNRLQILLVLASSTVFGVLLLSVRVFWTQQTSFIFLIWNIFLALIPLGVSLLLAIRVNSQKVSPFIFWVFVGLWLLFFPNAPYILTDLFHLKMRDFPFWYDLVLLLIFAWTGTLIGFLSLLIIHDIFTKKYGKIAGWIISFSAIFLGSFGIYLGRYLRWNSWDMLTNPLTLAEDIWVRIFNPFQHPTTIGVTFLFTILLSLMYASLLTFNRKIEIEKEVE
ncbi:MAG: DUF1361 domain-containing protein [Bacteroidetes bacterium]|nr:DUF1361 domain-containing protein [Bacteroidota bacterium]